MTDATPALLAYLSRWLDESQGDRDAEAVLWGRVAKVSEEAGEAIAALIGATGQNPRKGITHTYDDVVDELLDVAVTAMTAVEHMTGNEARSLDLFHAKVGAVAERAGAPT
ncbi:MAG: MazG-like family protein [Nocardioides sp.]|uniref:MazG-like family protein n=1 Tax=Nocardioides sp. TaxID=35761 RepID=UPI003D6AF7AA